MCESEKKQFYDLFTYEKIIPREGEKNSWFENCTLLKSIDKLEKGEKVQSIEMSINLFVWKEDKLMYDITYIP